MGALDGRVAVVTGAGRGIGREHALLLAAEGAAVVINDLGDTAAEVVEEITADGGRAVANGADVSDSDGARRLIDQALEEFGDLHVLVNNAGILRDRALVGMPTEEWDLVLRVHLNGHFEPTKAAAAYWRAQAKAGVSVDRSLIHTSSTSGLIGNFGQSNYGAAKAAIAAFSTICQIELGGYGVRSNAIAPAARTRLTESVPGGEDLFAPPSDPDAFDVFHPGNISPLVAALAMATCPMAGKVLFVRGGVVSLMEPWTFHTTVTRDRRWGVAELAAELAPMAAVTFDTSSPQPFLLS
jgi:NAD(P)-dependent dehydrogenase (short-subunit alcohol dehydrogenase family)